MVAARPNPEDVMTQCRAHYKPGHFRHEFARLREAVALKIPSIAKKHFADTRDTAVTRLAEATCTIAEICSITGHSEQSATQILRHFLPTTDRMADSAIKKYTAYLEAQGPVFEPGAVATSG